MPSFGNLWLNTSTSNSTTATFTLVTAANPVNYWVPYTVPDYSTSNQYTLIPQDQWQVMQQIDWRNLGTDTYVETPEEAEARKKREAARKHAETQAKELLKEVIGEEGIRVLEQGGRVRIGGMYEIDYSGCCYKLLLGGAKQRFCIIPDRTLPWGDTLVNKIMGLISDAEGCERVANWLETRWPEPNWEWLEGKVGH